MSKRIKFSIEKPKYYIHSDWRFSDGCLFSGLCGLFTPSLFATFLLSALLRLLQFNRICIPPLSTAAFVNQTRERAALQTAVLISFVHNTSLPPLQPLPLPPPILVVFSTLYGSSDTAASGWQIELVVTLNPYELLPVCKAFGLPLYIMIDNKRYVFSIIDICFEVGQSIGTV